METTICATLCSLRTGINTAAYRDWHTNATLDCSLLEQSMRLLRFRQDPSTSYALGCGALTERRLALEERLILGSFEDEDAFTWHYCLRPSEFGVRRVRVEGTGASDGLHTRISPLSCVAGSRQDRPALLVP